MAAPTSLLKGFEKEADAAKPDPTKRRLIADPETRGLFLRITPKGAKSWTIVSRRPDGKQVWAVVCNYGEKPLSVVRALAVEGVGRIRKGEDAYPKPAVAKKRSTFKEISEDFIRLHARNKERPLRSANEIERIFKVHLWPEWQDTPFVDVRRGAVTRLLDKIEANNGAGQAHHVLALISKLCNWYAVRDEGYVSPIIRGMGRTKPSERVRKRILNDDEIRLFWRVAKQRGPFGALLQLCLLTAQRKGKVEAMRWCDIADDGTWTIPTEPREKTNPGKLRLSNMALAIVHAQPEVAGNPYVFPGRKGGPFMGFSPLKRRFDAKMVEVGGVPVEPWVIHDLRRTAKSLMARAGVRPDISERVLGHAIQGVEGVYDRHTYDEEKAEALNKLAGLVQRIIDPQDNVVELGRGTAR